MKQEEKSKLTKEKILLSAQNLFSSKGYDETKMDDIAEFSGNTKGALYHHYKSKQDILRAMILQYIENLNDYMKALTLDTQLSAKQKIHQIIEYFSNNLEQEMFIQNDWLEKVPLAFLYSTKNTLGTLTEYFEKIILQGVEEKSYSCKYPREIASVLLLLFDIWLDPNLVKMSPKEMEMKIEFIVEFLERFDTPLLDLQDIKTLKKTCVNLTILGGNNE